MDEGVGARLREARTRRRLAIPEVEAATKIRSRYLLAIENEEWDQLPGDTYARAFIRTYGSFLGLDGDRLAEEQRRGRGAVRPGERLPRVDTRPRPVRRGTGSRGPRISPKIVTAAVVLAVIAALIAIGISSGGGSGGSHSKSSRGAKAKRDKRKAHHKTPPAPKGHELVLLANAEVWVCLLNGKENTLVNGAILGAGERAGPFRSGSFTLALGNGAVTMSVDGKQQNLPQPSSPIGFRVGSDGKVRELPEGERPTCT
jgi:cytoskeleton protein RodZ